MNSLDHDHGADDGGDTDEVVCKMNMSVRSLKSLSETQSKNYFS